MIGSAITHLAKGLDVEEAIGSLIVLVLLLRTRREFVAPGDPESVRPLLQVGLALAVALPFAVLPIDGTVAYSDRVDDALLILIGALAVRGFFLWLRPIAERARHVPDDFRRAEALVQRARARQPRLLRAAGRTSRGSSRRAATRSSRTASSPAPRSSQATRSVIPPSGSELIAEFRRVARAKAWRVAITGASAEALPRLRGARVQVDLPRGRGVRSPGRLLARRAADPQGAPVGDPARAGGLPGAGARDPTTSMRSCARSSRAVSAEWRGRWPERGFTMAMDGLFAYPDTLLAVACDPDGGVGGFLQLVPSPACAGYSLASMRRRRETPNGLMEFLIVETIAWARAQAVTRAVAQFLGLRRLPERRRRRVLRTLLLKVDRLFQLERLHSFNRKFFPDVAAAVLLLRALDRPARSRASPTCTPSRCSRRPGRGLRGRRI